MRGGLPYASSNDSSKSGALPGGEGEKLILFKVGNDSIVKKRSWGTSEEERAEGYGGEGERNLSLLKGCRVQMGGFPAKTHTAK